MVLAYFGYPTAHENDAERAHCHRLWSGCRCDLVREGVTQKNAVGQSGTGATLLSAPSCNRSMIAQTVLGLETKEVRVDPHAASDHLDLHFSPQDLLRQHA
jgi:hypothetical protein